MKSITPKKINQLKQDSQIIREKIIQMAYESGGGQHLGGGLSMIEIMSYLNIIAATLLPAISSVTSPGRGAAAAQFALVGAEARDLCVADRVRFYVDLDALGIFASPLPSSPPPVLSSPLP